MKKLIPCLWFDRQAEEAAEFYCSVLPDTSITSIDRAAADYPAGKKSNVLKVEMSLVGNPVTLLNGGPYFQFNEAVSFQLFCEDQAELDRFWQALSTHPENEQCGWAKDRYGLSWQIIPRRLTELMSSEVPGQAKRVMQALLKMKKLDIGELEAAAGG